MPVAATVGRHRRRPGAGGTGESANRRPGGSAAAVERCRSRSRRELAAGGSGTGGVSGAWSGIRALAAQQCSPAHRRRGERRPGRPVPYPLGRAQRQPLPVRRACTAGGLEPGGAGAPRCRYRLLAPEPARRGRSGAGGNPARRGTPGGGGQRLLRRARGKTAGPDGAACVRSSASSLARRCRGRCASSDWRRSTAPAHLERTLDVLLTYSAPRQRDEGAARR